MLNVKTMKKIIFRASVFVALIMLDSNVLAMQAPKQIKSIGELREVARSAAQERFDRRNLLVFDGADSAVQCHINALMVVRLALEDKSFDNLHDDQQGFLLNNFIRSMLLRFDTNDGPRCIERLLHVTLSKKLRTNLRSAGSSLVREVAGQIIQSKKKFFDDCHQHTGLWDELAFHDTNINRLNLPEFIGIQFVLEQLGCNGIWTVLTCKTICGLELQVDTFLISPDQMQIVLVLQDSIDDLLAVHGLAKNQPVVVIEGQATLDPSRDTFEQHCNLMCGLNPANLQRAITAVHMRNKQVTACEKLSSDVREEFELSLQEAERLGVLAFCNATFFIRHTLPDSLENALGRVRNLFQEQMSEDEIDALVWNI